ncbi:hypothetical protein HX099_10520 [Thiopseudomonas alkaliphila]|uniref:Uncharacterized protein n=1 Tax=Thiopseudomonas alkaliphila TaxID=1697053 RepID=A0AAW7DSL4_9GAMM|nr:hypothetical protein [Thiopseudomonas alkaliphila]MDM1697087.1 hypothetical protein [Thiopseudomonas alkaliphila]
MSSKPIFYSSDDAGSPGANPTGNRLDKIRSILKACLVDGYGDKPAAGWELVHDLPTGFSLSNGEGVINFVNGEAGHTGDRIGIYIAEKATDTSSGLIEGVNLRSGGWIRDLNLNGTKHTYQSGSNWDKWLVVADNKTVFIYAAWGLADRSSYPNTREGFYFGSVTSLGINSKNFVAMSNGSGNNFHTGIGSILLDSTDGSIARTNLITGSTGFFISAAGGSNITPTIPNKIIDTRLIIGSSNKYYACLRFIIDIPIAASYHWPALARSIGLPGNDFWSEVAYPVNYNDTDHICFVYGHARSFYISDSLGD